MSGPTKNPTAHGVKISATPAAAAARNTTTVEGAIAPDAVLVAARAIIIHYLPSAQNDLARNPNDLLHVFYDLMRLRDWVDGQFRREATLLAADNPGTSAHRVAARIFYLLQYGARQWPHLVPAVFLADALQYVARFVHHYDIRVEVTPANKQESKR